jgi:hypothetical protein
MLLALANVNIKSFYLLNDVTEMALGHFVNLTLRLLAILSTDTKSLSGMGKELSKSENWAEFSTLKVAACIPCKYVALKQNSQA